MGQMKKRSYFHYDLCQPFRNNCVKHFLHLSEQHIDFLEIGIFEGKSGCWALANLLAYPTSTYTGIDTTIPALARRNLKQFKNVTLYEGASSRILKSFFHCFDFIYIDGDHNTDTVFLDSMLCWQIARRYILWDDYKHVDYPGVEEGVQRFLANVPDDEYRVVIDNFQFGIEII